MDDVHGRCPLNHEEPTVARPSRERNQRGSGEQLRTDLLAAADEILDRTGDPAQVTIRGLAAAVGVAPNAVYLHFRDRDTLLAEIAIARYEACTEAIRAAAAAAGADPMAALFAGHAEYCRLALERPGHYRLLFHGFVQAPEPSVGERLAAAALGYFQTCIDCCTAVVEAGAVPGRDPAVLAGALWALEHGWCEIALAGGAGETVLPPPDVALRALLGPP
jgi:AcrR family transcriptional regulator